MLSTIARKLNLSQKRFEKQSAVAWIEKRLLEIDSELLQMAKRYGVKSTTEFLHLVRKGKIADTADTIDDFFKLDHLEAESQQLKKLNQSL